MVVITETGPEMFWGLTLDEGKRYTQTVESSFHISMAAIEPKEGSKEVTSVYIKHNNLEYLLCSLQQGSLYQQTLDLGFLAGETLTLFTTGKGTVHMTGYRVFDEEDMMEDGDEDLDSDLSEDLSMDEEEDQSPVSKKKKLAVKAGGAKAASSMGLDEVDSDEGTDSEDDEDDSDDGFRNGLLDFEAGDSDEEDDEDFEGEDLEDDEDDSEPEMSESEVKAVAEQIRKQLTEAENKKGKTPKSEKKQNGKELSKTPDPKQSKTPQAKTPKQEQGKKEQAKTPKQEQGKKEQVKTPKQTQGGNKTPLKRKLPSGVTVEDLKEGHGPEAKASKMVHVYYTGKLTSGKVFDSSTGGRPFKFRLGKNEVIKGWELGIQGMKVGGKRRLTIPPNLAYGSQKLPGIPPGSTLLFDVELKTVS